MKIKSGVAIGWSLILFLTSSAPVADYHVGPGQPYTSIGAVPWYTLAPGDNVYIHYAVYHEKFLVSTQGSAGKPIRIIGIPDELGNRPVIDGKDATTSKNNHHRWQTPSDIQWDGVVFVGINSDTEKPPAYIEISHLEIRNGYKEYSFTAENGATSAYESFAAGIYLKSPKHVLIEDCVIHDNGQAIYNWAGDGSSGGNTWWDGVAEDITLRGNYFYNNGMPGSYLEHQTYTEARGVVIEFNHYGAMRPGEYGSQLKDRSAGTIIRYNYFDFAPAGWYIDLVEPENSAPAFDTLPEFNQTFVYGNVIINSGNYEPNFIHWNQDHYGSFGRATQARSKLLFYNNTVLTIANRSDMNVFYYFNVHYGGYDCPPPGNDSGIIDIRNNIFAVLPRTPGQPIPEQRFAYCGDQNFAFGVNWVSPGWSNSTHANSQSTGSVTGTSGIYSPEDNNPDFISATAPYDLRLTADSDARDKGGAPPGEATDNALGLDLSPVSEYVPHQRSGSRDGLSSLGAFEHGTTQSARTSPRVVSPVTVSCASGSGRLVVRTSFDKTERVTVFLLDVAGRTVATGSWQAVSGLMSHSMQAPHSASGIYVMELKARGKSLYRKTLLTRDAF